MNDPVMSRHRRFGVPVFLLFGVLVFASAGSSLPAAATAGGNVGVGGAGRSGTHGGQDPRIALHASNPERRLVRVAPRPDRTARQTRWSRGKARIWGSVQRARDDVKFGILRFLGRYLRIRKRSADEWGHSEFNYARFVYTLAAAQKSYGAEPMKQTRLGGFRFMRPEAVRNKLLRGLDGDVVLMRTTDRYNSPLSYVLAHVEGKLIGIQLDPQVETPFAITPPFEVNPRRFTPPGGKPVVAYKFIGNYRTGLLEQSPASAPE
jgi:hypothetical protein